MVFSNESDVSRSGRQLLRERPNGVGGLADGWAGPQDAYGRSCIAQITIDNNTTCRDDDVDSSSIRGGSGVLGCRSWSCCRGGSCSWGRSIDSSNNIRFSETVVPGAVGGCAYAAAPSDACYSDDCFFVCWLTAGWCLPACLSDWLAGWPTGSLWPWWAAGEWDDGSLVGDESSCCSS